MWRRLPEKTSTTTTPTSATAWAAPNVPAFWHPTRDNTLGVTARHSLSSNRQRLAAPRMAGALGRPRRHSRRLRLHTQLFTGYGDSLIDYNRRRTVLSVGLSLVDF